jgi:hypothetical protein
MGCTGEPLPYRFYEHISGFKTKFDTQLFLKENKILAPLLKAKLNELAAKRDQKPPEILCEGGNYCDRPCYEFRKNLCEQCPKCEGSITIDLENPTKEEEVYDEYQRRYKTVEKLLEGTCTKFKIKNLDEIDYDCEKFFEYFDKYDKEKDKHYMIIDGERFDAPANITIKEFFLYNNDDFFDHPFLDTFALMRMNEQQTRRFDYYNSFYAENQEWRAQLGQAVGYYGYANLRVIYVYNCNKCKLSYHVLRISPLRYRDKSKDNKITVVKNPQPENNA